MLGLDAKLFSVFTSLKWMALFSNLSSDSSIRGIVPLFLALLDTAHFSIFYWDKTKLHCWLTGLETELQFMSIECYRLRVYKIP